MQEQITRSYVITKRLDTLLREWATDDERTISAQLRYILEREAMRREVEKPKVKAN
ncbi:MAG: hypothetical protein KDJ52_15505 [Anaerolineae bacterium]|nr:hypothetical protein [Anaerolineae bacterium]